jgi:hypothetical protein
MTVACYVVTPTPLLSSRPRLHPGGTISWLSKGGAWAVGGHASCASDTGAPETIVEAVRSEPYLRFALYECTNSGSILPRSAFAADCADVGLTPFPPYGADPIRYSRRSLSTSARALL